MASTINLYVNQGTDFERTMTVYYDNTNVKATLTDYTVAAKMKHSTIGSSTTAINITAIISDHINGKITISLTNAITNILIPGRYLYDIEITSPTPVSKIHRIAQGILTVNPTVT